jgi:enolase-phosphatase E1
VASLDGVGVEAVLLDVEGTTTPVAFVYEVLFPHARAHMREFLRRHGRDDPAARADIDQLRREHRTDQGQGIAVPAWDDSRPEATVESAAEYALFLMDGDRKATGLKGLQGRIWQEGYTSGALRGQVYPDVPPAFARWGRQGRAVAIFSSGSMLAQRLLFATTPGGDLTPHIRAHFDTTTGSKREAATYARIAQELGVAPGAILFLSDTAAELDAAREGGMAVALCARDGAPAASPYPVVHTFDAVCPAR